MKIIVTIGLIVLITWACKTPKGGFQSLDDLPKPGSGDTLQLINGDTVVVQRIP